MLNVIVSLLVLFGPASGVRSQIDTAYDVEMTKGHTLLRQRRFDEALKSFKRANEMRGKKCAECLSLMVEAYLALESYKSAVENADKVIELAGGDKQLRFRAYNNKGIALQTWAEKKDQKRLQAAEAAFRQALSIEGAAPVVRYNLGVVLLQLNRDAEGIAELQQYINAQPTASNIEYAKKLVGNPRRARESYAPEFSFTSLDGAQVSLEDLKGKVVLLDFWGTWCQPCVESIPDLRNLHKKYSKEPAFVFIGISSDRDDELWREFTAKNKMVWPQYRDKDQRIQRAFGVRSFPTYIVIDHEGIVRHRSVGLTAAGAAPLDRVIGKQLKIIPKSSEGH
ncbi:MAG TPA: redoxin domain-containing protein [Pyrinomonadaceae bacterium]|nr:redoxin domain-containing protein [Pyrinomonadaceae bacterium]